MNINYFGMRYSFTHIASLKRFGNKHNYISKNSITDCIGSLSKDSLSVVPIENTYGGIITDTLDALADKNPEKDNLIIKEELEMKIELYLLSKKQINFNQIEKIYSNEYALRESKDWLEKNVPKARIIRIGSTSEATLKAGKEKYSCAIASSESSKHYGLRKLAKIDTGDKRNITRFFVIGIKKQWKAEKI